MQVTSCSFLGRVVSATQKSCEIFPVPQIPHLRGFAPSMSEVKAKKTSLKVLAK